MIDFYLKLCRVLFTRYREYVVYWLTFNEINMILHAPFMGAGLCFSEGENEEQVKYQAAHHELVASALATRMAHEINPANQVGCMFAALVTDQENYFFVDVQARGYYPAYARKRMERMGVFPRTEPEDAGILRDYLCGQRGGPGRYPGQVQEKILLLVPAGDRHQRGGAVKGGNKVEEMGI